MNCQSVRQALELRILDPAGEAHIAGCPACALQRRIVTALRSALVVTAPPELSARLLTIIAPAPAPARLDLAVRSALVAAPPPELRLRLEQLAVGVAAAPVRRRPWVMPVYAATALLLGVLLFFAAQAYGLALQQLGITDLWRAAMALPAHWLQQFYTYFPQGRYIVDAFVSLQQALQWVLVGLLIWAVLEMRAPQRGQPVRA